MAAVAKDLALGSVILVACIGLLAVAFTTPSTSPSPGNDPVVAMNGPGGSTTGGPDIPPVAPYTPPQPDREPDPEVFTPDDAFGADQPTPVADESVDNFTNDPMVMTPEDLTPNDVDAPAVEADSEPRWDLPVDEMESPVEVVEAPVIEETQPIEEPIAAAPVVSSARTHTVVSGETYQSISSQYYGTTRKWRLIQEANDTSQYGLMPGMTLTIPALDEPTEAAVTGPISTPAAAADERTYKVQSGDSYYTIARDQLGNAQRYIELERLNGIDPLDLQVGMTLKLPASGASVTASPPSAESPAPAGSKIHVVELGEILGDISTQYYGTSRRWRAIADANGISDATSLREGQRLIIPDAGTRTVRVPSGAGSASPSTETRGNGQWHEVKQGQTFQVISNIYYGTTTRHGDITAANPGLDSTRLQIGTRVWVPGASPVGEQSAPRDSARPSPFAAEPVPVVEDTTGGPDWDSISP